MGEDTRVISLKRGNLRAIVPEMSPVAFRIMGLIGKDAAMSEIATELANDSNLSHKIVSLAKFSSKNVDHEVTSIHRAAVILGMSRLQNVVLGASILDLFPLGGASGNFSHRLYWEHAALVAEVTATFGTLGRVRMTGEEFEAGLLHDIGRFLMAKNMPATYTKILEIHRITPNSILGLESREYGTTHCEVGFQLASSWQLSKGIQAAINYHHYPERETEYADLVNLVCVADLYANSIGVGFRTDVKPEDVAKSPAWNALMSKYYLFREYGTNLWNDSLQAAQNRSREFVSTFGG